MSLMDLVKKAGGAVEWLDDIPSIPAAAGAFIVGLLTPKWVVGIVIVGVIIYGVIKYNGR